MKHLAHKLKNNILGRKYIYAILLLVVIFGIYLRSYHIDYPTIGYHNMKEDEFLSFALNMHDSGDYLRTRWFDCSVSSNDYFGDPIQKCNFNEGETPVSIWFLIFFFTLFGWKLWAARLMIILFTVLTAVIIYLIINRLSKSEYLALLSAFIFTVLPLSIFFGRNVQMDSPALFFSALALYFFIIWNENKTLKYFIFGCAFFVLTAWFKVTSLFVLSALLLILDYKSIFNPKKRWKEYVIFIITIIISLAWIMFIAGRMMPNTNISSLSAGNAFGANNWIDTSFSIFTSQYWNNYRNILSSYIADNYSWTGFWLIIIGFALFFIKPNVKLSRLMFGYAIGIALYIILFAYKWNAHNYYQFPFLIFAAVCISNIFYQAGMLFKSIVDNDTAKKIVQFIPLLALLLLIAPFKTSTMRQFDTQFFGQDIAGRYINQHTAPGEIFLLERGIQHQVSWTARRFYYSIPDDVELLKRVEQERNLRYIVLTNYGIQNAQLKKSWSYITENYRIAQAGFIQSQQGSQLYHLVLERGGTFNITSLNSRPAIQATTYELSYAKVPYYTIE